MTDRMNACSVSSAPPAEPHGGAPSPSSEAQRLEAWLPDAIRDIVSVLASVGWGQTDVSVLGDLLINGREEPARSAYSKGGNAPAEQATGALGTR
ncbi:hypothetical protein [Bordetella genomosp. 9]|uniref:hypothetical protein n=1 Tax=Bordetella genomosp. 9 TaxID=1416803 RepID=UPI0012F81B0A|nr:hypothetical protein [Bordetella genomosp. 9]